MTDRGGGSAAELWLSLRPGTVLEEEAGGACTLVREGKRLRLSDSSPAARRALVRLAGEGAPEDELAEQVVAEEGQDGLLRWYARITGLEQACAVAWTVRREGRALARLQPIVPGFRGILPLPGGGHRHVLSRFAYVHRRDAALVLESPRSRTRLELLDPAATALVQALSSPRTTEEAAEAACLDCTTCRALLALLHSATALTLAEPDGETAEDRDASLMLWTFPDLLFHSRCRIGRHDALLGGLWGFDERVDPLPVVRPPMGTPTLDLAVPDLDELSRSDTPFTRVLETRRSIRRYADDPMTLEELGAFLYRVARVKKVLPARGDDRRHDVSLRPSPGGGAIHELELYPVVGRCRGLERGIYHYDPLGHRLEGVPGGEAHVDRILADCRVPPEFGERHILIVVTARFGRMMWKYRAMAYAATLRNVGVLYQTMYLVATAMELAPCGLGSGDADLFARILGTGYEEETSVGEFMLGSRPVVDVEAPHAL